MSRHGLRGHYFDDVRFDEQAQRQAAADQVQQLIDRARADDERPTLLERLAARWPSAPCDNRTLRQVLDGVPREVA